MTTTPREIQLTDEQYHKFLAIELYRNSIGLALGQTLNLARNMKENLNSTLSFHWQVCQEVVLITGFGNEWEYLTKEFNLDPLSRWSIQHGTRKVVEMLPGQY